MSQSPADSASTRLTLLLIAGTPLTMILAASWLWYFVVQGDLDLIGTLGTANNGQLVRPPRQITDTAFRDDLGAHYAWSDVEPRWTFVITNRGSTCDQRCERRLYTTRQIHAALGQDFNRIRRAYIADAAIADSRVALAPQTPGNGAPTTMPLPDFLVQEQRGLIALQASSEDLDRLFPEQAEDTSQWYLVDPAGWIMMRFTDDLDYKAVIADLKFLLKNSGGA